MAIEVFGIPEASAGFSNYELFTTSGTWTVPSGVEYCAVYVCGGGGAGQSGEARLVGSAYNSQQRAKGGAGGSGGAISVDPNRRVTPGETITVTVGGQASASSFGNLVSGYGSSSVSNFGYWGKANRGAIRSLWPMSSTGFFGAGFSSSNNPSGVRPPLDQDLDTSGIAATINSNAGVSIPGLNTADVGEFDTSGEAGILGGGGAGQSVYGGAGQNATVTGNSSSGIFGGGAGGNSTTSSANDGGAGAINTGAGGGGGGGRGTSATNGTPAPAGAGGAGGSGFVLVWY